MMYHISKLFWKFLNLEWKVTEHVILVRGAPPSSMSQKEEISFLISWQFGIIWDLQL